MQSNQPALQGSKLRSHIEKKPYTQKMNDIDYTYSIIPKKQKSFVFTNNRFLVLKGIESISYAREFPSNVPLPFRSPADLPKPKQTYPVAAIEHCNTEQQKLIIEFSIDDHARWQFICPSKGCAHEWRKRIEIATNELVRFNLSKMERYEDYLAKKRRDEEAERLRKQQQIDRLNRPPHPPPPPQPVSQPEPKKNKLSLSQTNGIIANTVDILIKPEQKPREMFNTFKLTDSGEYRPPAPKLASQTLQKNTANHEDITTLQRLLTNGPSNGAPLLKKSVSTLSIAGKQSIKSQIASYRRNWLDELIAHKEQTQLIIDFKNYIQKIVEVIVTQLYIPQDSKIFPSREWTKDYASFIVEDVYVEVYFYGEEQLEKKHHRERYAAKQFKNYDYLLECTRNQGLLVAPFMVMFEYKGFTGMARTKLNDHLPYANKQCLNQLNLDQFRQDSKIQPRMLAQQSKCKIVAYEPQRLTLSQSQVGKVYIIERLSEFLPSQISETLQEKRLLRPELVQNSQLQEYIFGDRQRQAGPYQIQSLIDKNIDLFVGVLERQEEYFANSKELSELMHSFGLNMRHLGLILARVNQLWLRDIIKTQIAARCLKNFFRFDMQNCVMNQTERIDLKQKQTQRQKKRAISFLNVVLGNSEATFHLWRSLNHYCKQQFKISLWQQRYEDINVHYFLQAIQTHFKILLSDEIHKRVFFKSPNSLSDTDFIRFVPDITIYNLDFTLTFEKIYDCMSQKNAESFGELCRMMTKQTNRGKPYLFMLKEHPIYDKICEYFLYFITPEEYHQFYSTLDEINLPSRFAFECHLTQIKWFIKNKPEFVIKPIRFVQNSGQKWLGQPHPVFVKMNHTLAEYYMDNPYFYSKAVSHANEALEVQQQLNQGESEWMWKDYYLIGKIHFANNNFQNALPPLMKAKQLAIFQRLKSYDSYGEMILSLSKTYFALGNYRQAYLLARQLYSQLREQPQEEVQEHLVESVALIRSLLEKNQEYEAYYKFVETDFSHTLINSLANPAIMAKSIKLIIIPYLKYVIHQKVAIRSRMLNLIEELFKVQITYASCESFIEINIRKGKFPQEFFNVLRDIQKVIDEIYANNMIQRWLSFNRMSQETLLERIGGSQLSREFEFLAEFTSVLGLLGDDVRREFILMEK